MTVRGLVSALWVTALAIFAASCEQDSQERQADVRQDPVVVYAAFRDDAQLRDALAAYTDETGVLVIIRGGDPDDIVDDLIANEISPPADLLITRSVAQLSRAAEEGALRPVYRDALRERAPAWSRDPDDLWFGTGYRAAVVAYATPDPGVADLEDFAALAEPRFREALCLSASANPVNRAVIAMMIEELGVRPAELVVRGWIANLAQPVFATDAELLSAIRSGSCRVGIVSSQAVAAARQTEGAQAVASTVPAKTYADIDGVGVARHARNPEGAAALIEWLLSTEAQERHAADGLLFPTVETADQHALLDSAVRTSTSAKNVGLVAWHQLAAVKLAERARYF